MNSYQLISKLRKVRADTYLTTAAQALYHELVAICNEMKWKEEFFVRSSILCNNLDISDNILRKSRDNLADAGLLFYRTSRDKRIGCFYSFVQDISDASSSESSVISSAKNEDDIEYESTDDIADDTADDTEDGQTDIAIESKKESSAIPSSESSANFEDDKKGTSATSSAIIEDDTAIPPIIDIQTINGESPAHTRETPPPRKKKSSRKKEGDGKPLEFPFASARFMSAWEALCQTPKWKKKLNYALQLSLNKLGKFEEDFAVEQIERAIESNWTGVVFPGTEEKYQEWLNLRYGNNRNIDKAAKARMLLDEYLAIEQGNAVGVNQTEIPDL